MRQPYLDFLSLSLGDAAETVLEANPLILTESGGYVEPNSWVDAGAWDSGYAPSGANLGTWSMRPAWDALKMIANGTPPRTALYVSRMLLTAQTALAIMDAANQASAVDVVTRPQTGFIRMVEPGACARCLLLAGKFYRYNAGFLRHPRCKCRHIPASDKSGYEKLVSDPAKRFAEMSHEEQDSVFGKAGAEAIRLGADMAQVVHSRRGMEAVGRGKYAGPRRTVMTTTEGMGRYGWTRLVMGRSRRLTPEGIMALVGNDRERTIKALTDNGYILPSDWKQRLYDARTPLLKRKRYNRKPQELTAAQKRLQDAELKYESLLSKKKSGGVVDDHDLALAERNLRRWQRTAGEVFSE